VGHLEGIRRVAAITPKLIELASRRDGVALSEMGSKQDITDARNAAEGLVAKGQLHKVKLSHRSVRYYADKRVADTLKTMPKRTHLVIVAKKLPKSPWPEGAEAVITENTKITICPSPPPSMHKKPLSNW
jgi:hypothetical protein